MNEVVSSILNVSADKLMYRDMSGRLSVTERLLFVQTASCSAALERMKIIEYLSPPRISFVFGHLHARDILTVTACRLNSTHLCQYTH